MTITFVAAGAATDANSTSIAPGLPAGLTAGDVMVLQVLARGVASTVATPGGWTQAATVAISNSHRQSVFYKVAGGGEGAPTVTQSVSGLLAGRITAWRGCDQTTPLDVAAVTATSIAATTFAAPSTTPVSSGAMALWLFTTDDDNTLNAQTQGTSAYSTSTTTGLDGSYSVVYELQTTAAATGTCSLTQSANGPDTWNTVTLALRPAAAASANPSVDLFDGIEYMLEFAFGESIFAPNPVWFDETAYLLDVSPMNVKRGRDSEFAETQPGSCSFTLRNETRRFDPDYTAGPYFGNLVPMVQVRFRMRYQGVTYAMFRGLVLSFPQIYYGNEYSTVTINAIDMMTVLATTEMPSTLLEIEVLADEPDAYWPMLEETTAVAVDQSGNGGDGSYLSMAVKDPSFLPGEPDQLAKYAAKGVAPSQYDIFSTSFDLFLIRTFEVWFRVDMLTLSTANPARLFMFAYSEDVGIEVDLQATDVDRNLTIRTIDNNSTTIGIVVVPLELEVPYHVVGTLNDAGTTFTVYINGQVAGTIDTSAGVYDPSLTGDASVRVGTVNQTTASLGHMAVYDATLSSARVLAHYAAGTTGGRMDTAAARLERLATYAGLIDADLYDGSTIGNNTYLAPAELSGDVLSAMRTIVVSEQGRMFVNGAGVLVIQGRAADMAEVTENAVSQATFLEMKLPTDIGYSDLETEPASRDLMRNTELISLRGVTVTVVDQENRTRYGPSPDNIQTVLNNPTDARNLGLARLRRYSDPTTRITALVVEPRANPTELVPLFLQMELGWRITVQRTPQRITPAISDDWTVEGIDHIWTPSNWTVKLYLAPAEESFTQSPWLVVGHATYGKVGLAAGNRIPR